jgi:hypothetical protein
MLCCTVRTWKVVIKLKGAYVQDQLPNQAAFYFFNQWGSILSLKYIHWKTINDLSYLYQQFPRVMNYVNKEKLR